MDESSEIDWLDQRDKDQTNTNDEVAHENDDDDGQLQYGTNNRNDSVHQDMSTFDTHYNIDGGQLMDDNTDESSGDESLEDLKKRHGYYEYLKSSKTQANASFEMNTLQASGSSEPPIATVSTASSSSMSNYSAEHQPQFESFKNMLNDAVLQNMADNGPLNDLLKNMEPTQLTGLLETIVRNYVNQLLGKYELIPKDAAENKKAETDNDKSSKKRKHRDNHGQHNHRSQKEKRSRYSSTSSLDDSNGPSSSRSRRSVSKSDISSSGSSNHGTQKRKQTHRSDKAFHFSRPRQPKLKSKSRHYRKDDQNGCHHSVMKNTDKTLYLTSQRAKICPICTKTYKRMVNHFRRVHSKYEVFVSRVSPQMADSLLQSKLPVPIKYVNASGMQYLKMMCAFCEVEKDFFAPYWANHMRTHTGEYTRKCMECGVSTMSATHCGWPTSKPKCNLYATGLNAYICIRCNYMQMNKKNIIAHLKKQHCLDSAAITSIENEYRKIALMAPLKDIETQANPNDNVVQVPFVKQQPLITGHHSDTLSLADASSSSGIQVIEDVLIRPRDLNPNDIVDEDDDAVADFGMSMNMNRTESDAQYLYGFENGGADDDEDDLVSSIGDEMVSEPNGTTSGYSTADIKVDTIDDQTLENVANDYNQIDMANMKMVRPWIEDDYGQKPCINAITQFALYKCMHEKCIFATNSLKNWFIHMTVHIQLIDYYKKQNMIEKQTRDKLIKFRECAYCSYKAKKNDHILHHLEAEHHRSIFQCSLCFYRTIEMANMTLHMNNYHPSANGQNEVYLCGDTLEFNQQDEEMLEHGIDYNVKKIQCGQGDCTEEYFCYDSLYAHLIDQHPDTGMYECPYCKQTMGLDETMIIDHLTRSHQEFKEFECLKCQHSSDHVDAIREHMSVQHPSHYLFIGARRTWKPNTDEIQMIYFGSDGRGTPFKIMKCSQPDALNGMDPKVLVMTQQHEELQELQVKYNNLKTMAGSIPKILIRPGDNISIKCTKYETYEQAFSRKDKKSEPVTIAYKCITAKVVKAVPAIAEHINFDQQIDPKCKTIEKKLLSMIRHRLTAAHNERPMVFLQIENQQLLYVKKVIRCTFQCELCAEHLATRKDLRAHFIDKHRNKWFAAKICIKSHVIESNDPQQPIHMSNESFEYFFSSYLKCAQAECDVVVGTRSQAIAHYNECHDDVGSKINGFQVQLFEKIVHNPNEMELFAHECKKSYQMYLFECHHCRKLFDSYAAIEQHFADVRMENAEVELRFVVKRLLRCLHDNVIRTYAGLKQYENEHADIDKKFILPVNMLWPNKYCGMCSYQYVKDDDLVEHYRRRHIDADAYSYKLLDSLGLKTFEMNSSKFAMGCCGADGSNNDEYRVLRKILDHMLKCEHRFVCIQCPQREFSNITTFVKHSIENHKENWTFKKLLSLLSDMKIILRNGLVVTMKELQNTTFVSPLMLEIGKLAEEFRVQGEKNHR